MQQRNSFSITLWFAVRNSGMVQKYELPSHPSAGGRLLRMHSKGAFQSVAIGSCEAR